MSRADFYYKKALQIDRVINKICALVLKTTDKKRINQLKKRLDLASVYIDLVHENKLI